MNNWDTDVGESPTRWGKADSRPGHTELVLTTLQSEAGIRPQPERIVIGTLGVMGRRHGYQGGMSLKNVLCHYRSYLEISPDSTQLSPRHIYLIDAIPGDCVGGMDSPKPSQQSVIRNEEKRQVSLIKKVI